MGSIIVEAAFETIDWWRHSNGLEEETEDGRVVVDARLRSK